MIDSRSNQLQMVLAVMKAQRGPQSVGGSARPSRTGEAASGARRATPPAR